MGIFSKVFCWFSSHFPVLSGTKVEVSCNDVEERNDCNNNVEEVAVPKLHCFDSISDFLSSESVRNRFTLQQRLMIAKALIKESLKLKEIRKVHKSMKPKLGFVQFNNKDDGFELSVAFHDKAAKIFIGDSNTLAEDLFVFITRTECSDADVRGQLNSCSGVSEEDRILASDLIDRMRNNIVTPEKVSGHPLFWKAEEKIDYFIKVNKYCKLKHASGAHLDGMSNYNPDLFDCLDPSQQFDISPTKYKQVWIDCEWMNVKDIQRGKEFGKMKKIEDFMKYFRNMWEHADDHDHPKRGKWLGADSNGITDPEVFWKNITQPWPDLLLHLYYEITNEIDDCFRIQNKLKLVNPSKKLRAYIEV